MLTHGGQMVADGVQMHPEQLTATKPAAVSALPLMTVEEAATDLRTTPKMVRKLIGEGRLQALRLGHRTIRVIGASVEAMKRGEVAA